MTKIHINDLEFKAIVGAFEFERIKPQRVVVDIECDYRYSGSYLDYANIAKVVQNRVIEQKYRVLEEGIDDISQMLRDEFPNIESLKIKIAKPDIIKNCKVSVEKIL